LAVFAHPDDESLACGGVLALAARRGARVSLVCATAGESRDRTGARVDELHAAARVLGIAEVTVLRYDDGMLPWADGDALEADIRAAILRERADTVITFGEDGLYWHPDHIAIHERTTAAIAALGAAAPALYYATVPPGQMRGVMDAALANIARQPGDAPTPRFILGIEDPEAFGAFAVPPTLVIDTGELARLKLAAIKCHVSQLEDDAFTALTEDDAVRLLRIEHFRHAGVGAQADGFLETLGK
jgi:LmbE family N-acetylglucosaminyl deacetylase